MEGGGEECCGCGGWWIALIVLIQESIQLNGQRFGCAKLDVLENTDIHLMLAVCQIKIIFHPNVKKIKIVRQVIFKTLHALFYIILNRLYSWFICGWISCLSVFSVLRVLSCRCTMPPVGSMNVCRPYYTKTSLEPWSSLSLMMQALWVCSHIRTGGKRNVFRPSVCPFPSGWLQGCGGWLEGEAGGEGHLSGDLWPQRCTTQGRLAF